MIAVKERCVKKNPRGRENLWGGVREETKNYEFR